MQREGWPRIATGAHTLLIAPTGSGKTLAAFFSCIDRLSRLPADAAPGVRVLYVSPLKALVYDIERNLRAPLEGIRRAADARGERVRLPRVAVRTGDTPSRERRVQARDPSEILVTTPESLYLILGSQQRETLRTVETVIVDEIHALAPTKRGAHLALSLERLSVLCHADPQRIGLSATARPLERVAGFLGGDRAVGVVDTHRPPNLDLEVRVPVPDMTRPDEAPNAPGAAAPGGEAADGAGLWPALHPRLLDEIRAHRSTIVFVNSRGLCERLAQRLNELAGEPLVRAHHGSVAHDERRQIEEALSRGALRGIVATSSLELGIDMDAVDLVLLVESPGSVARGLQRIGRAGHQVGAASRGRIYPKHRGDLLEATVVAARMRAGEVEPLELPRSPLDVLAQQIVAMVASDATTLGALEACVRRAASYTHLSRDALHAVLDMLAGRYPSTDFAELRPRIVWDRETDRLEPRRGSRQLALVSGGTIPDRGLYAVHLGEGGPRIGELDEEMVHETRPGDAITLGASTWRVEAITRDRVIVAPAPGEVGRLPFWRGDGPGRPLALGRAVGAFTRELAEQCVTRQDAAGMGPDAGRAAGEAWLRERYGLDAYAARNLVDYVVEQQEVTGALPTDRAITVERFRDELGDWRVCILSPFGARLHAPWALAIEARLGQQAGFAVQALWSDDGIALRFADADAPPDPALLLPDPDALESLVVDQLGASALFAGQFRENAARALLLPRRRPGQRTPLWTQRLRAQNLLAVARGYPSFPIVLETYRTCLQDVFDLPALALLLRDVRAGRVRIDAVETREPSPFARSLAFAYTAAYLYQGDVPVAERRAQALTLDRQMLRDLLGHEELRELLDASVIDATEAELQAKAPSRQARHPDAVHDLLRRLGDLSQRELRDRCDAEAGDAELAGWLAALEASHRALRIALGGEPRWIAAEDAGLYRDALGVALPGDVPAAFLAPVSDARPQLARRFARQRGPFVARTLADRYRLDPADAERLLHALTRGGPLVEGAFHPRGREREWCDAEVLRRLRRRTLAKLRGEVAPVDAASFARFLASWHRIDPIGRGDETGAAGGRAADARLEEALERLEGVPLSFGELERLILPARVPGFDPRMLDEQGALGRWVWIGCGALGETDGRIALYRRERAPLLADSPPAPPDDLPPLQRAILERLEQRGASFFADLVAAAGDAPQHALEGALWELVWQGRLTNDTFAPLRALSARRQLRERPGRRPQPIQAGVGRWSAVASLLAGEPDPTHRLLAGGQPDPTHRLLAGGQPDPTRRLHARAVMLLERYGVVSRDVLANEALPGGFSALYAVYRQMEESGKLRRGHFVAALSGAQFAYAGAVDRLRAARGAAGGPAGAGPEAFSAAAGLRGAHLLAATDPASPFGSLLPWPAPRGGNASLRRAVGASVVVVDGALALYLDRGARVATFASAGPCDAAREEACVRDAAHALRRLFAHRRRRSLRIEEIDGVPAARSRWRDAFVAAGFRIDYKGLVLERSEALARP